jgi:hypothetical protein
MEPGLKASTMPGRAAPNAEAEATLMERKTIGSDEATVMENFGASPKQNFGASPKQNSGASPKQTVGASPKRTVASPAMASSGNAEATVLERQTDLRPGDVAPKKNTAMFAAITAIVVLAIVGGIYFATHRSPAAVATTTGTPSSASLTATAPAPSTAAPPAGAGQGALLLSASPWGDIQTIVSMPDRKPVDLSDEKRSTPTRIDLDPGKYSVTLNGPKGAQTFDVEIRAGEQVRKTEDLGGVNYSELEEEMKKQ